MPNNTQKNLTGIRIQDVAYKQLLIIILVAIATEKILLRYLFPEFYKLISINDGWLHFIYNMLYKFPFIFAICYCLVKSYSKKHTKINKIEESKN